MRHLINASGRLFRTTCVLSAILTSVAWTISCSAQDVTPAAAEAKDVAGESPPYMVLNDAESLDRWAGIGSLDKLTLNDERKEGKKAIGFKKTGTTLDYVRCSLSLAEPLDLSDTGRFSCWLYIADPKPINKISLWLGNTERWHDGFLLILLKPWKAGWNHIDVSLLQFGAFTKKADWSDIKIFSIEISTYNPTDTYGDFLIDDLRLWPVKDFVAPSPEPKQQDNPYAMVDGKPFFPVGVYGFPYDAPDAEWREAASLGINMVCPDYMLSIPQWREFLDKAHAHGMKVVCGLIYPGKDVWSTWWATDLNEKTFRNIATPEEKKAYLRKIISALKDHPALMCWDSCDEISQYGVPVEGLLEGYKFVKKLDPDHPVWLNHGSCVLDLKRLAYYNQIADVVSIDIYPVPTEGGWSNLPDKTISSVGGYTKLARQSVAYKKPVWMVLQSYKLNYDECPTGRFPTLQEFRFMTYDAIVAGTKGIVYFLYLRRPAEYPRWTMTTPYTPEFWAAMKSVLLEMKDLRPALLVHDSRPDPEIVSENNSVKGIIKEAQGRRYLICINRAPKPVEKARISVPGETIEKAVVLYEGRWAKVKQGEIVDDFAGYDVHVYELTNE